ncbi:MAG: outer membrane beta-barrel protein [Bacteroidales bacterium]|nr:outer membrane beta-barrel protein [Bacteroidales bacterium]
MKKVFQLLSALVLLLALTMPTQAQSRKIIYLQSYEKAPYHFGFLLGANFMGYSIKTIDNYQSQLFPASYLPAPVSSNDPFYFQPGNPGEYELHGYSSGDVDHFSINRVECSPLRRNIGFSVGVIGDLRLSNSFNLRLSPTLSLGSREIYYDVVLYNADGGVIASLDNGNTVQTTRSQDILATYAELPLHVKYRSHRYNNIGAYLIAGVNPKLFLFSRTKKNDVSSNSGNDATGNTDGGGNTEGDGNTANPSNNSTGNNGSHFLLPKRGDVALEFGVGYDIYNQWFKMGVELKMSVGMFNLLREEAAYQEYLFQAPISSLKNRQLQLTFTFE